MESQALQIMRRMLEQGFAAGDVTVVDELCSPDLVEHQFGLTSPDGDPREHIRAAMRDVHTAFPDLAFSIEDHSENGDVIWVRARACGTATGPFFGPPSGQPIDFTVIDVARIRGGRIVEHWGVPDRFAVLAQTGVLARLAA